jgi:hypothetical protein
LHRFVAEVAEVFDQLRHRIGRQRAAEGRIQTTDVAFKAADRLGQAAERIPDLLDGVERMSTDAPKRISTLLSSAISEPLPYLMTPPGNMAISAW